MIRRAFLGLLLLGIALGTNPVVSAPAVQSPDAVRQNHVAWVIQCLTRMQSIKPRMTRADLLKLFTTEGGIQTGTVFVFRECPYFKVTVEWETVGRLPTGTTLAERTAFVDGLPGDVIKTISRPYIQGMIID